MKKSIILSAFTVSAIFLTACGNTAMTTTTQTNQIANSNKDILPVASSHSGQSNKNGEDDLTQTKPNPLPNGLPSNSAGSSSAPPMNGQPIDTSEFDAAIAKAEKTLKSAPNDATAKKALAEAYAKRGFALTEAAQYRAALGDFRKSLKLNAANKEVQEMHDQILSIYQSMKREPPKEGEEPPPLPFKAASVHLGGLFDFLQLPPFSSLLRPLSAKQ